MGPNNVVSLDLPQHNFNLQFTLLTCRYCHNIFLCSYKPLLHCHAVITLLQKMYIRYRQNCRRGTLTSRKKCTNAKLPYIMNLMVKKSGPIIIKLFLCSTQISKKIIILINVKMPTIVGILTFVTMIGTTMYQS